MKNDAGDVKNPVGILLPVWQDPPSCKMAVSLIFEVYGPSGVPNQSNFTPATLKTQTENYFRFAGRRRRQKSHWNTTSGLAGSAILKNGRQSFIRGLWPVSSPDQMEFLAGDAQNPNGKLLPVCRRHVAKWPLTAKLAFSRTKGPCSNEK